MRSKIVSRGASAAIAASIQIFAACHEGSEDQPGHKIDYVVDSISLPTDGNLQKAYGDDLDGDGIVDNGLGAILTLLATAGDDLNTHAHDMIASGVFIAHVELLADDPLNDSSVQLSYMDRNRSMGVTGKLVDGAFEPVPTSTGKQPGFSDIALPVFADADPIVVPVEGLEVSLAADGTGLVRGRIPLADAQTAAFTGMSQMLLDNPLGHLPFQRLLDVDHDGTITRAEFDNNDLIKSLVYGDLTIDGADYVSLGFQIHVAPCDGGLGTCPPPTPVDSCFDRVTSPAESSVDCGGSCPLACPTPGGCKLPSDCQSNACDTNLGRCLEPTCSDGVRDGVESDIDCGGNCGPCALTKVCAADTDCMSNKCDSDIGHTGNCMP